VTGGGFAGRAIDATVARTSQALSQTLHCVSGTPAQLARAAKVQIRRLEFAAGNEKSIRSGGRLRHAAIVAQTRTDSEFL
jgi:hypothetical protein